MPVLSRLARGGLGLVPLNVHKLHHAFQTCASLNEHYRNSSLKATCHLLFLCLLYQFEFPRLLAKREIIANALLNNMLIQNLLSVSYCSFNVLYLF